MGHVRLRATSGALRRRALGTLGVERTATADWIVEWGQLSISPASDEQAADARADLGFAAPSREHVEAFWEVGVEAGLPRRRPAGPRPEYGPDYYGGFLLDPDGNSAEAVHHDRRRRRDVVDHLWFRVADVEAAKASYVAIAAALRG